MEFNTKRIENHYRNADDNIMKKMNRNEMRAPSDLVSSEKRTPVSARIKESSLETLEKEAKKLGVATSALLAGILDDYATWLGNDKNR